MFQNPTLNSSTSERLSRSSLSPHDGDDEQDGSFEYDHEDNSYEQEDDDDQEDDDLGDVEDEEAEYELSSDPEVEEVDLPSDGEMLSGSDMGDDSGKENGFSESKAKIRHRIIEPPEFILQTSGMLQSAFEILEPGETEPDFMNNDLFNGSINGSTNGFRNLSPAQRETHLQKVTHLFLSSLNSYSFAVKNQRLEDAAYLAKLLLPLHYPPPLDPLSIDLNSNSHLLRHAPPTKPRPLVLLQWLNEQHQSPDPRFLLGVTDHKPNPGIHRDYWFCVQSLAIRCRLQECRYLLGAAKWNKDGGEMIGSKIYPLEAASAIQKGCALLQDVILQCPIIALVSSPDNERVFGRPTPGLPKDEHWETGSLSWRLWRSKITRAIEELESMSHPDPKLAQTTKKTEPTTGPLYFRSKKSTSGLIPFEIAKEIKIVFEILRGDMEYITGIADNWFDAVGALVAFHSEGGATGEGMDIDNEDAYDSVGMNGGTYVEDSLKRITKLFHAVTKRELPLPATRNTETILGDILAGRLPEVLSWIKRDSLLVASATVELLGWGGHCDNSVGRERQTLSAYNVDTLNDLDLENEAPGIKETTITAYAKALRTVGVLNKDSTEAVEGWEVGVLALKRVDTRYTTTVASDLVQNIPLDGANPERTDRLLDVCSKLGFTQEEKVIASQYGVVLKKDSQIGLSLTYFSRADNREEIHNILSAYIIDSLTTGRMVPDDSGLDDVFLNILISPEELREDDLLRRELSGFAALRSFFKSKSDGVRSASESDRTKSKSELGNAAKTLVILIRSAGEQVDSGVFDDSVESVIDVTCLGGFLVELLSAGGIYKYLSTDDIFSVLRVFEALFLVGGDTLDDVVDFYTDITDVGGEERERFSEIEFSEALGFLRVALAQRIGSGWLSEETEKRKAKEDLLKS